IPAFWDLLIMVDGNASMYLGSPRMAEPVIGEKGTLEEMGGARMHCSVSGVGDVLVPTEEEAIECAKRYLSYVPQHEAQAPPIEKAKEPRADAKELEARISNDAARAYDMRSVLETLIDEGSLFEIKALYAKEI